MMKRFPMFFLMGACLWGPNALARSAKGTSDIDRVREAAGTRARFDRLETVAAQANLVFASTSGVVAQPFAFEGRRLPAGGWAVRERMGADDQAWSAPGLFYRSGDMTSEGRSRERFFVLLAPDHLAREGASTAYQGLGYFRERLCRRLEVKSADATGRWTVYVDTDSHRLRGLQAEDGNAWLLEEDEVFQNQFTLPTRWTRFSPGGERMEIVQITALAFNVYLTDFEGPFPADPPVAPGLGDQR